MAFMFPKSGEQLTPRMKLGRQYAAARFDVLLLVAITVINLMMLLSQNFTYFLFSLNFPYLLVDLGMYFGGAYTNVDPALFESGYGVLGMGFFYGMLAAAIVVLVVYFALFLLSDNNRAGFMIATIVLFALDTLFMILLVAFGISEPSFDFFIDLAFHAGFLYIQIEGARAGMRLARPEPDPAPADSAAA